MIEIESYVEEELSDSIEIENKNSSLSIDQADLTLVQMAFSKSDSKFGNLLNTMSRIENAGHILCWTLSNSINNNQNISIDLLELPRLKLSFKEKKDENDVTRLFSMDHVSLYVSNQRSNLTTNLMVGIPHSLLMSSCNGELQILVPTLDPVRPRIGSSPFSTELVMNRLESPDWYANIETSYNLYPIHVSLSFLFSPTLSSSLYLLLLRFLHRDYEECFKLINTIGTDTNFSKEENQIFQNLGNYNSDCHPDAHACRLKIALMVLDAPISLPFDITIQASRYIVKQNHVSSVCRINLKDELSVLELCVCESNDPRFYDPETEQPKYSMYEITLIKNRKFYLSSCLNNIEDAEVFPLLRVHGSRWTVDRNLTALMVDESSIM